VRLTMRAHLLNPASSIFRCDLHFANSDVAKRHKAHVKLVVELMVLVTGVA
jgi:hypothetical protein